jgi:hypothetical protein
MAGPWLCPLHLLGWGDTPASAVFSLRVPQVWISLQGSVLRPSCSLSLDSGLSFFFFPVDLQEFLIGCHSQSLLPVFSTIALLGQTPFIQYGLFPALGFVSCGLIRKLSLHNQVTLHFCVRQPGHHDKTPQPGGSNNSPGSRGPRSHAFLGCGGPVSPWQGTCVVPVSLYKGTGTPLGAPPHGLPRRRGGLQYVKFGGIGVRSVHSSCLLPPTT